MATKAKSQPAPKPAAKPAVKVAPVPPRAAASPLAASLGKAIKLVEGNKHAEAIKVLETLVKEAQAAGEWGLKRRAEVYLTLCHAKSQETKLGATDVVSEIEACLNRRDSDGAAKLADKAIKAHPDRGILHYLKAVAHAQNEQVEASADAMKKAMELDGDLVFQWHMEPDFNAIRKSALFAFTEAR